MQPFRTLTPSKLVAIGWTMGPRSPDSMLPLTPRDYLILFALVDQQRHGYGLVKDVASLSDGAVRIDPANLYRSLQRMQKQGWVEESSRRPDPEKDDERRRYYRITELGRRVLAAEAARLDRLARAARAKKLIPRSETHPI